MWHPYIVDFLVTDRLRDLISEAANESLAAAARQRVVWDKTCAHLFTADSIGPHLEPGRPTAKVGPPVQLVPVAEGVASVTPDDQVTLVVAATVFATQSTRWLSSPMRHVSHRIQAIHLRNPNGGDPSGTRP
jgi:hypothetical protein